MLGRIDGDTETDTETDGEGDGDADGDGLGVGVADEAAAVHCVPGRYSSRSEPTRADLLGEDEGEAEGDGLTLSLFAQGGPEIKPPGCCTASTWKCAWLSPLSMKSRSTELPTIVP